MPNQSFCFSVSFPNLVLHCVNCSLLHFGTNPLSNTMDSPPPYSPHPQKFDHGSPTSPSAPSAPELYPDITAFQQQPVTQQQYQQPQQQFQQQFQQPQQNFQVTVVQPVNPVSEVTTPQRMKCGTIDVGLSTSNDLELVTSFSRNFLEVKDGVMRVATTRANLAQSTAIPLTNRYVSIERKRIVVIQGNDGLYALRASGGIQAYEWLLAFSQFCFVAPSMEGYGEKYSKGSKKFEERFLRLGSDGILSWYQSDAEGSDRLKGLQVRGETFKQAPANPEILVVQLLLKGKEYKFRFCDSRTASLWLAAFRWHSHRKPYRRPHVSILNKAK
uniref:Uncharacterized protein LOC100187308 n=1 Tax=Phallusia mammillata TaxID=59560 RepID=A0A6F9DJH6_9ASCI|nr:uncharacterized protein LOC100187308 [Phallusia mammillata]